MKNAITQLRSFTIDEVEFVRVSANLENPPNIGDFDFEAVEYVETEKTSATTFEFLPNKLATNLIVLFDALNTPLGYLYKLYNFAYVKQVKFILKEEQVSQDFEVTIYVPEIYAQHSLESPTIHPAYYNELLNQDGLQAGYREYNETTDKYLENPEIGIFGENAKYIFDDYSRTPKEETQTTTSYFRPIAFEPLATLEQELGYTIDDPKLNHNLYRGSYLYYFHEETKLVIIFPITRSNKKSEIVEFTLPEPIKGSPRVFLDFNNPWFVYKGTIYMGDYNDSLRPLELDSFYLFRRDLSFVKSKDNSYLDCDASYICNFVWNRKTKKIHNVVTGSEDEDASAITTAYDVAFGVAFISDFRLTQMWYAIADSYELHKDMSSEYYLGNMYCAFRHKKNNNLAVIANYPSKSSRDRLVLQNIANFTLSNKFLVTDNLINLDTLENSQKSGIQYVCGSTLYKIGERYIIC